MIELGFTLIKSETKKVTSFTHGNPAENLKKFFDLFNLTEVKNKLVFTEDRDHSGKLIVKTGYHNYVVLGEINIQLQITPFRNLRNYFSSEEVIFSRPVLNKSLPPKVANFSIEGKKVKEISC